MSPSQRKCISLSLQGVYIIPLVKHRAFPQGKMSASFLLHAAHLRPQQTLVLRPTSERITTYTLLGYAFEGVACDLT
ncbi:hypothetical protein GGP41_010335 [Bipolaris sorokiniana]|uniref:Uncharacterized protein n=1 Tax=Cochliobolus sativus TaxID=45130 RepID=A0A8H5ZK93_COCSA|nr:hypothetical protein GGP41_010335 [Bipolaris sorokiniana]